MNAPAPSRHLARSPDTELERLFALQRAAFEHERYPHLATRRGRLHRLRNMVVENEDRIVAAVAQDFGCRSAFETRLTEVFVVTAAIRQAQRNLKRWMKS